MLSRQVLRASQFDAIIRASQFDAIIRASQFDAIILPLPPPPPPLFFFFCTLDIFTAVMERKIMAKAGSVIYAQHAHKLLTRLTKFLVSYK